MDLEETFLDHLTTIDELIRKLIDEMSTLAGPMERLNQTMSNMEGPVAQTLPRKKRTLDLTHLVPAESTDVTTVEEMPFDGYVGGVTIGWPDGADQMVGVRLENAEGGEKYYPAGDDNYSAFNDLAKEFQITFPIHKGDEIQAVFVNNKTVDVPMSINISAYKKFDFEDMSEIEGRLG